MMFWDTSALLNLIVQQAHSAKMQKLVEKDSDIVVWWGTSIECISAIARLERQIVLTSDETAACLHKIRTMQTYWSEIQPSEIIKEISYRLLRVHNLTAADALQLGAAIVASENRSLSLEFVCLDKKLTAAAEKEGFRIVNPSDA